MNLKNLTNNELHFSTVAESATERMTTMKILWHLRENDRRMLYAQMGYKDLKEYCIKELKYSEGSAWRRISAMKLLVEVPEIEEKIESGELNLTQLNMARTHFREVKTSINEKKEILLNLKNQSTKTTERILAECKPDTFVPKPEIKERALKGHNLEVTIILDKELQDQLNEIQILLGKPMSKLELFKLMSKEKLEKLKKENTPKEFQKSKDECKAQPQRRKPATKTRYIAKNIEREIKLRDQHRCQWKDSQNNKQCSAQLFLQKEHIIPFAKGGANDINNLELLCPNHNRLRAVRQFGTNKMRNYLPALKN